MKWLGVASGVLLLVWTWKFVRARPILGFAFFFIFFQIYLRTFASLFLDAFGPVYAIELGDDVGGTGATFGWAICCMLTTLIVAAVLSPRSVAAGLLPADDPPLRKASFTLGDLGVWATLGLLFALFVDMLSGGVIPLFDGLERWEYTENFAGPVHRWFFEYGILYTFILGALSVYPRVRGGETDLRFVGLLGALFLYCILAGHRFSIFYALGAYFVLPRALVYFPGVKPADPYSRGRHVWRRLLTSRLARVAAALVVLAGLSGAIINSLLNVRGFAPALAALSFAQRALVQPQQFWFLTYDRVLVNNDYDTSRTFDFLFFDAIDPTRNTTVQYLMSLALGEARTQVILDQGAQYAGGFPEIAFELSGPYFGWILVVLQAVATAAMLRELLRSIYEGRFVSMFAVLYVLYALFITYIGGMLNNYVVLTFWVKVTFMFAALLLEKRRDGSPRPLIPWVLWHPRQVVALSGA